ncbi:choice-of-anchor B family protein [Aquimarina intermedia]|uniref:Choice-of-anchor B domain-containing protein n=1 Tax=Aquimarina intermedia TaxID=350814 RepID=A0A5S5CCQ8_9FLAO|nr:choice-of-anchor B family protein [Aquimarina intermedia]TYP76939.1 choice-of-anchor B domain-containing protein [Aquimarina intermedia]
MKFFLQILLIMLTLKAVSSCKNDDNEMDGSPNNDIKASSNACINGLVEGKFPCDGFDLVSRLSLATFDAYSGNDSWGWTDPDTGKEYVLLGLNNGTAFIDISLPSTPKYLGKLPTATEPSKWRDIKVYKNYAFVVSEAKGHGMQIFDLTRLRNVESGNQNFTADAMYSDFGSAHNIVINTESGYAYAVGARSPDDMQLLYNGGPHFINIQDPLNPINEGGYSGSAYSHDAQAVTYKGPDIQYIGREILIGSNANQVALVDITDKNNPKSIATISYSQVGYTHQGWFTEDMKYFLLGDELDEPQFGFKTRTIVFDFTDLDNPKEHMQYSGSTAAADHNGYIKNNKFYQANYESGMRVIDLTNIANKSMTEIGFFDTYPSANTANLNGSWSVYPFFESNNIVISDTDSGLFIVKAK